MKNRGGGGAAAVQKSGGFLLGNGQKAQRRALRASRTLFQRTPTGTIAQNAPVARLPKISGRRTCFSAKKLTASVSAHRTQQPIRTYCQAKARCKDSVKIVENA